MIDRVFRKGYVVDFLHFSFFKSFPVFNVADCAVVLGAALLILYFLKGAIKDAKKKRTLHIKEAGIGTDENNM